jgi:group I intron endonuclease
MDHLKSGIYAIKNLLNGKLYIGSARDLTRRFNHHKARLRLNAHHNKHLQSAWNLYGETAFAFEILEFCHIESLLDRENIYLKAKGVERYNLSTEASGFAGWRMSERHKQIISATHKGKKKSEQIRKKISSSRIGKYGGTENPACKLTKEDGLRALNLLNSGLSQVDIAEQLNISQQTVSLIKLRKHWTVR